MHSQLTKHSLPKTPYLQPLSKTDIPASNSAPGSPLAIVKIRMKKLLVILLALTTLASCGKKLQPEESCNFVQNSQMQRVSWKGRLPVPLYVHSGVPQEYHAAIQYAIGRWEVAMGRPMFEVQGVLYSQDSNGSKDDKNVIYYSNTWEPQQSREQGRTTIHWLGDIINEADMKINAQDFSFFTGDAEVPGKVDMESLMVHELGHILGLQHNDDTPSVMATTLGQPEIRRDPSPADVASIKCEYGF